MLLHRRYINNISKEETNTIITFSVEFAAETKTYQALKGMTWDDFVNSDYNVGYNGYKFYIEDDIVWGKTSRIKDYAICEKSNIANDTEFAERSSYVIIPNGIYTCKLA